MRCAIVALFLCSPALSAQTKAPDRLEKTIHKALKYLHRTQDDDGAWRLSGRKNVATTSLAVMAFMSAGHVPGEGPYGKTVEKGIRWVLKTQQFNGVIASSDTHLMYEHGISTLMLAEAMGMTDAKLAAKLKTALEKAVKIILRAQRQGGYNSGGWRYKVSGFDADVSVTGWQMLALKAAKNVGCDVPAERIKRGLKFVQNCRSGVTGGYCYRPGAQMTTACTGTAILCLELFLKHKTPVALRAGSVLLQAPPQWKDPYLFYTVYYCSQATFQLGGNYWAFYRPRLHNLMFDNQRTDGSWADPSHFGPAYATSMSVLALTVEYRFLPIYQRGADSEKDRATK